MNEDCLTWTWTCLDCGRQFPLARDAEDALDAGCPACGSRRIDLVPTDPNDNDKE